MPEKLAAVTQVSDLILTTLKEWGPLQGFTIRSDQSTEEAADASEGDKINLWLVVHDFDVATQHWQVLHTPIFEAEVITRDANAGSLSRTAMNAIAEIVAALSVDRTLGQVLQDLQEVDTGSTVPGGRDVTGASIQFRAEFYTSREDWFTIVTQTQ